MKKVKALAAMLALSISVSSIAAQQMGQANPSDRALKGVELKGKVPVNREPLKVGLPRPQEARLANGLRVLLIENHHVPTFSLRMVIESDALSDPADRRGLSMFTASMLREGTKNRTSRLIAEQIDSLGSTLFTAADLMQTATVLGIWGLIENLDQTLDIFSDMILYPAFKQEEVESFKARMIFQLQSGRAKPGQLPYEMLYRAIYGDHPAAIISPPLESVRSLTPADLVEFHSTHYRPNNAFLLVYGDVAMKEIMTMAEKYFGKWEKGAFIAPKIPTVAAAGKSRIHLINRPGSAQTVLMAGNAAIERTSADYYSLQVMSEILGGAAGRLYMNLREENGYAYNAYSQYKEARYAAPIIAMTSVKTENTEAALKEFIYEIKRISEEKALPLELENAKRTLVGRFAFSLDLRQNLILNVITQTLFKLPADYWDTYPQRVASVTLEDVQRVARKYLDLASLQIIAAGDAAKIHDTLSKYGAIELYDAEGRRARPEGRSSN